MTRIVIDVDGLTTAAHIEGVTDPTELECEGLRELARVAGSYFQERRPII
jgi:hypothetical protein